MDRRGTLVALSSAAAAFITGRRATALTLNERYRVVVEVTGDTPQRWDGALRNVENLRRALGPDQVQIQVIVHGKALHLLRKTNTEMSDRLQSLANGGVQLSACENTMRREMLTKEMLFSFSDTVDSAVAELVRKQTAGWAYLKVG